MDRKNSRLMSPILFASPTTSVVAGRSALADTGALSTKFRRPFWIDEIRLSSYYSTAVDVATNSFAMQARFKLGPYALSDRYIPFQNYAPYLNEYNELASDLSGGVFTAIGWFRWKLPKPLFISPGMTLVCDFFRPLGKTPATASADVAYVGRYLRTNEPGPKEVDVPWVTMFDPATDAVFAQSSELDLYNPFQVPLEVQRLLAADQDVTPPNTVDTDQVTVMKDSGGSNIIRDFTPTGSVFDITRRAWSVNRVLAPRERYNITLQALTGDLNDYHVSLVGSRKERL